MFCFKHLSSFALKHTGPCSICTSLYNQRICSRWTRNTEYDSKWNCIKAEMLCEQN